MIIHEARAVNGGLADAVKGGFRDRINALRYGREETQVYGPPSLEDALVVNRSILRGTISVVNESGEIWKYSGRLVRQWNK